MKQLILIWILTLFTAVSAVAQNQQAVDGISEAIDHINAGNWSAAKQSARAAGPVGADIVDWYKLRAGVGEFSEFQGFLTSKDDWPGLPLLRRSGEASISDSTSSANIISYFSSQEPSTGRGALHLIRAFESSGNPNQAKSEAIRAWINLSLTESEQAEFLQRYSNTLAPHHTARLDALLWRERATEALRMTDLLDGDHNKLATARIGLMGRVEGISQIVANVPSAVSDDAGMAYERFRWRIKSRLQDGAIDLMLERSTSAERLGKPELWSDKRRSLARQMMRSRNYKTAYKLASNHHLTEGEAYSDLEWLSGYIALRFLDDPKTALRHFERFRIAVFTPISLGRAGYWEGRANEALNRPDDARVSYEFAAEYQTSFYGQLAAEKVGIPMDPRLIGNETYSDFLQSKHANSTVFEAAMLFHAAGKPLLFTRFTRHLAEILDTQERGALAQLALDLDQPFAALYMAKYAANDGVVLMRPYYPITDIVDGPLPVAKELTLAIARRESEFYPASKSPVGARGLMQLMPKTAQEMAGKLGLDYELSRLIDDPAYNARLGSAYLAEIIDDFGTGFPLVAAAYNAGPSRPKNWMKLYGDPRSDRVDAVDWVEHIPFRETRNYVMRVMESMPVYRARLSGKTEPLRLSKALKGR